MKLTDLLDQIDRLELEIYPGPWVANDRGIGYEITTQQQIDEAAEVNGWPMPINSGIKDTFPRSDAEFIALARTALPTLAKALRAVLELHKPYQYNGQGNMFCEGCSDLDWETSWPCDTVQAITDVFEDSADGQALDQARAEDDGTRITLDKYLEGDDE